MFVSRPHAQPAGDGRTRMPALYEIRADHDREVVVVHQRHLPAIAGITLQPGPVVPLPGEPETWIEALFLMLLPSRIRVH